MKAPALESGATKAKALNQPLAAPDRCLVPDDVCPVGEDENPGENGRNPAACGAPWGRGAEQSRQPPERRDDDKDGDDGVEGEGAYRVSGQEAHGGARPAAGGAGDARGSAERAEGQVGAGALGEEVREDDDRDPNEKDHARDGVVLESLAKCRV